MAELFPTKTRLALLQAATETRNGRPVLYRCRDFTTGNTVAYLATADGDRLVTARVSEAITAGWLREGRAEELSMYARRPVELTDAGRAVLDTSRPATPTTEGAL